MQKGGGVSRAYQSNSSSAEQGETDGPVSAASANETWAIATLTGAYMAFVTWITF